MGLPKRAYGYEYCRRLARAAICGPFDEAITLMGEATGVRIPKRLAEQVVAGAASDFEDFYAAQDAYTLPPGTICNGSACASFATYMATQEPSLKWSNTSVKAVNSVSETRWSTSPLPYQAIPLAAWSPTGGGTSWFILRPGRPDRGPDDDDDTC